MCASAHAARSCPLCRSSHPAANQPRRHGIIHRVTQPPPPSSSPPSPSPPPPSLPPNHHQHLYRVTSHHITALHITTDHNFERASLHLTIFCSQRTLQHRMNPRPNHRPNQLVFKSKHIATCLRNCVGRLSLPSVLCVSKVLLLLPPSFLFLCNNDSRASPPSPLSASPLFAAAPSHAPFVPSCCFSCS